MVVGLAVVTQFGLIDGWHFAEVENYFDFEQNYYLDFVAETCYYFAVENVVGVENLYFVDLSVAAVAKLRLTRFVVVGLSWGLDSAEHYCLALDLNCLDYFCCFDFVC